MKKEGVLILIAVALIALAPALNAQEEFTEKGYQCLETEVENTGCSSLTLKENIFTVLSTGQCVSELKSRAEPENCFGSNGCSVKETSQSIIALKTKGEAVDPYIGWLKNQTVISGDLNWFLQPSPSDTTCEINDSTGNYEFDISSNDQLSEVSSSSSCLSIPSNDKYKMKVDSTCYENEEFSLTCQSGSATLSKLFEPQNSDITHLVEGESSDTSKINSFCFGSSGQCSYEGTLWGTLALQLNEENYKDYLPHLVGFKNSNVNKLPETFLYKISGNSDYLSEIKSKQRPKGFWFESGNKYKDTALALFAMSDDASSEKENAINWTKKDQQEDGCWNNYNIADTGFILYALDPKTETATPETNDSEEETEQTPSCKDNGYFCLSSESKCTGNRTNGEVLSNYSCSWESDVCCSQEPEAPSCEDVGGTICSTGQTCEGNRNDDIEVASGFCCKGTCKSQEEEETSESEQNLGSCKSSCGPGQVENSSLSCLSQSKTCCTTASTSDGSFFEDNLIWIIIVLILAILITLAIVYRKKLKGMFGKGSSNKGSGRRGPPKKMPGPRGAPPKGGQNQEVFNQLKKMGK